MLAGMSGSECPMLSLEASVRLRTPSSLSLLHSLLPLLRAFIDYSILNSGLLLNSTLILGFSQMVL
jgi:hypothetical protein